MLKSLFVIDAGLCIYSYHFAEKSSVDEQLLSGFLTAIGSFAKETFQTGLQTINIRSGEKLNFYVESETNLIFCGISDVRDNNILLETILAEIAEAFTEEMKDILNSKRRSAVGEYKSFNDRILPLIKRKDKKRDGKAILGSVLFGGISIVGLYYLTINVFTPLINRELFFLLYLCGLLCGICATSGYIAGNPKRGIVAGILFFISFYALIGALEGLNEDLITYIPFLFIMSVATGYFGGLMCDRTKLYPLEEGTLIIEKYREQKKIENIKDEIKKDALEAK